MKQILKYIFYKLGVLSFVESIRFKLRQKKNRRQNLDFKKNNSEISIPPDFYLYETFGLDYTRYYTGGKKTAEWIINHFQKYIVLEKVNILDWGCGPGRIIRHIPDILNNNSYVFGSDYNKKYVNWCNDNLKGIVVKINSLAPPLLFESNFFSAIFSISIFTHLSEKMHHEWMKELNRVSKKGAILLITTHGNSFLLKLNNNEKTLFNSEKLVEQQYKIEGNRLYATYHPPLFFQKLVESHGFEILEHIESKLNASKPEQDVWIIKKS